jgi:hypothetical protein
VAEWWISGIGDNMLKGVNDEPLNPIRLPDSAIVDFLTRIPEARASFLRVVPLLLPEEQQRLLNLALFPFNNPLRGSGQDHSDAFQRLLNTQGIRTAGPNAGTRIGGNVPMNGKGL